MSTESEQKVKREYKIKSALRSPSPWTLVDSRIKENMMWSRNLAQKANSCWCEEDASFWCPSFLHIQSIMFCYFLGFYSEELPQELCCSRCSGRSTSAQWERPNPWVLQEEEEEETSQGGGGWWGEEIRAGKWWTPLSLSLSLSFFVCPRVGHGKCGMHHGFRVSILAIMPGGKPHSWHVRHRQPQLLRRKLIVCFQFLVISWTWIYRLHKIFDFILSLLLRLLYLGQCHKKRGYWSPCWVTATASARFCNSKVESLIYTTTIGD